MSIKDLFDESAASKLVSKKSIHELGSDVESADYVRVFLGERESYIPQVDFSKPENFAIFGSAESYYEDAITRIHVQYPYDGSLKEKLQWRISSSFLDQHLFENDYPRTNGHALLSPTGWGTLQATLGEYGQSDVDGYIQVKGGPHEDPNNTALSKIYPSEGGTANILDASENRESNLKCDLQNDGFTVEFWLQKDGFTPADTSKEVLFDLWNGEASSSAEYGRLTIEISGTSASESPFRITAQSGTAGYFNQQIGASIQGTGSLASWNHYAFSFLSASSGVETKFYINGDLNQNTTLGTSGINEIAGPLIANIGALRASPSGTLFAGTEMEGWGKLSGSIDEFRCWKTKRNAQDIGRYWFTQVGGGTNTDTANTNLGVYYKFNEGITGKTGIDSVVLDYSGRISNGTWVGYESASRSTESAMVLAGSAETEFKDPIIYSTHPDVVSLLSKKRKEGKNYDDTNNSSIYSSYPGWIIEEDSERREGGDLRKLTQIMASYLDTLHLQVESLATLKDVEYISGSINDAHRPTPLAQRLLTSRGFIAPEIFTQANILEFFLNRDEKREYDLTLSDVKNFIYQNINNNLVGIYKKKGTEQAFRNLIRCFGIDDELIKVNLYANNYTYTLEDNYKEKTTRKTFVDFADTDRYSATVHQFRNTLNSNTVSFISGSEGSPADLEAGVGLTVETEIFFPRKRDISESQYMETPFTQASLFGMHTADSTLSDNDLTWAAADVANFQVSTERSDIFSRHAKFRLTGSAGGFLPELTSSLIQDVYNNERWLVALRLKRSKYPFVGAVDGTEDDTYTVNFYGINTKFKETINEFELTGSVTLSQGLDILKNPKRIFAGAHRQNFTGSVLGRSDVKVGAVRVWYDYLSNDTLKAHAVDPLNYGADGAYKKAYLFEDHLTTTDIKKIETLALNWDFQTVTGSSASGQFNVIDFSSGSVANSNRHGWISNIVNLQHSGRGFGFVASDTNSVDNRYVYTYKPQLPEVLTNNDTVQILERDDEVFTRDTRPVDFYYAVEKSLYQDISREMLDMFSTVKDFNNLIGEPVNRYRKDYKDLGKLRQLFFERVRNNPDFEKFTDFYKWFDNALNQMIVQLIPASAKISEKLRNVVESHILERNKYQTKYPFFKSALPGEIDGTVNSGDASTPWRMDPVGTEDIDPDWWHCAVDRRESGIATGNSIIDAQREVYRLQQTTCPRRLINLDATPGDEKQTNTQDRLTPEENTISIREPGYANEITIAPLKINPPALTNIKKGLTQKVKLPLNIVGTEIQSGRLPLDAYSSSYANPYSAIVGNHDLFVDHQDDGGTLYTTLQGPFTEKYVGGRQHRHVDLATPVLTGVPAGFATADYSQPMSVGDRTATITVTYSPPSGDPNQLLGDPPSPLVNAQGVGVTYFLGSAPPPGITPLAGSYIRFDFGAGNEQHITELRWTQTDTHAQGNWKVQGSNDAVAWTDVSTVQVLAGGADNSVYGGTFYSTPFSLDLIGAAASYRYYQLLYDSGNVVDDFPPGSNINPIDFKIGAPTAATTAYLLPTQADRPEGFRVNITPAQEKVSLYSAYKDLGGNTNFNLPRAVYFRDEVAKRPLNIRNIHHTTGSTKLGNYDELYQVIQTSNRRANNRWWVKYNNSEEITPEVILDDSNSFLLGSGFASPHVSGVLEYIKPVRGKSPHVFVERFGAPGGPNSSGDVDGGPGLDALSAEYSIYSTVNYRNNFVRRFGIDEWSKIHSAQFGIDPNNSLRASFHKTNRNPIKKMEESGSSTITASMYDNYFVQHPIPQSDLQYAWITASAISSPFGYSIDARRFPAADEVITFLSASQFGSQLSVSSSGPYVNAFDTLSIEFDGVDEYIDCGAQSSWPELEVGEAFTVSAWFKNEVGSGEFVLVSVSNGLPGVAEVQLAIELDCDVGGRLKAWVGDDGTGAFELTSVTSGLNDGNWHHVLVSNDGSAGNFYLYVDGALEGTKGAGADDADPGRRLYLGAINDSAFGLERFFSGRLDEISFWTTSFTVYDVSEIYNNGCPADLHQHSQYAGGKLETWYRMGEIDSVVGINSIKDVENNNNGDPNNFDGDEIAADVPDAPCSYQSCCTGSLVRCWGAEYSASSGWLPTDFAGMNYHIYEPVGPSDNLLGYSPTTPLITGSVYCPSGSNILVEQYLNRTFVPNICCLTEVPAPETFNALMLHRNGPYQYPTWKQTRTGEHPISRLLRAENKLQYIARAPAVEIKSANGSSYVKPARFTRRRTYVEPVATSVFKPIVHGLAIKCDDGDELFTLKHSYGNNISHFSNLILDDNFQNGYGAIIASSPTPNQIYDDLLEFYVGGSLENSPVESLIYLNYAESIYPRAINRFLDRTRSRTEYDVKTEVKWRSARVDRDVASATNSQGSTNPPSNESCWSLDARTLFAAGDTLVIGPPGMGGITNQNDGTGELLNAYTQFHMGSPSLINPGALYARREPEYTAAAVLGAGDTLWETATQSGYEPFDDTYDDYSEFIRLKGQDYSIVPEFRISDHIDYYVEQNNGDFFGADLPDDWLRIDGAEVSSSADPTATLPESIAGGNNKFYSLYTHSDFLRYFKQIDDDHEKYKGELDHRLTLECKSIIKFRPRDGFYPVQRTLQLATLFSQSCASAVSLGGSDASWRTALAPFYAPGIMYNTIKSGIAVDYPLIQSSSAAWNSFVTASANMALGDDIGYFPEMYQPSARTYPSWQSLSGSGEPYYFISSSFSHRLPFEAILDPIGLSPNKIPFIDAEPHRSASLSSSFSIEGYSGESYKRAIDNFLAETINFYLRDGEMTSYRSKEFDSAGVALETSKEYIMDIVLTRDTATLQSTSLTPVALSSSALTSITSSLFDKSIEIYEREAAFGPPVLELSGAFLIPGGGPTAAKHGRVVCCSTAPYTPSYFDGRGRVRVSFKPTSASTLLSEILKDATYTYHRTGVLTGSFAYGSAMQISASIKFDTVLNTRSVTRDQKGNVISVTDQPGNRGEQWVIEPRFETPILDFSDVSITTPVSGAASISKGIWHQYGTLPQGSVTNATARGGLFLNLEYPSVDVVDTATTASLLTALGFDQTSGGLSKRLGNTSTSTIVSEAVVAIPFYSKTETVNNFDELHFLPLVSEGPRISGLSPSRSAVYEAMVMIALEGSDVPTGLEDYTPQAATPAIIDMVRKMNKYILPPKFDFLRFFAEREPLAMYIFDFEHEFNRLDLTNMWQNVSPPSGKDFKIMTSTVSHMIDPGELGGDFTDKQLRWLVFKVKQKAEKFYLNKTLSAFDDPKIVKAFSAQNKADLEKRVPYSYNWPYDYFSLIELIKIDADINIEAPHEKGRGKTKALNIKTSDNNKLAQASTTSTKKLTLLE